MKTIQIGSRLVGTDHPCFIAAEIGINHNGDLALAREEIAAAAECGADSVKFQNYRTDDFILDRTLTYEYVSQGRRVIESQYDMFKRNELTRDQLLELKACCDRYDVVFHATPSGTDGLDDLVEIGAPVLKNGSDYLSHTPFIRAMGETGLPTVLSTGMATLAEVDRAVRTFRETGNDQLILLHCTSSYPTPRSAVHLRKMRTLGETFGCPVGLSDHTEGTAAAAAGAALGAVWIEKHFTLRRDLPGPDHWFSSDPQEFKALVESVRTVETMLGDPAVGPAPEEAVAREEYRLSCVAARNLAAGHTLTAGDVVFRRPGRGIPPADAHLLSGRVTARPIPAGHAIREEDLRHARDK
jgi:N,N'-diacetyllegionaminate synthase